MAGLNKPSKMLVSTDLNKVYIGFPCNYQRSLKWKQPRLFIVITISSQEL